MYYGSRHLGIINRAWYFEYRSSSESFFLLTPATLVMVNFHDPVQIRQDFGA